MSELSSKLAEELAATKYACSSFTPLSGGTTNFIFRAKLKEPLDDGTAEVLIKHGEAFVAQSPDIKVSTLRCSFEEECLQAVQKLPSTASHLCSVQTPRLFYFDQDSNTQIQEYFPDSLSLKNYALKHWPAGKNESLRPICVEIGRGLGKWLRSLHDWAAQPEQSALRRQVKLNRSMQTIKHTYNYEALLWQADKFPRVLGDAKPVFEDIVAMAKSELEDESRLGVIHGDFWTGNILNPDAEIKTNAQVPILVVDWEMCQLGVRPLDLGQMIAELYELTLYKGIQGGLSTIEGFAAGYGFVDDEFAFRAALHVGTHLIGFGTNVAGWGTQEQVEKCARTGRDVILHAWKKDRRWFETHDLAPLFSRS